LRTIDEPLHLIKKIGDQKFLAFEPTKKLINIECPEYHEIEFKLAVNDHDWAKVK
jgi:hypothetical protein